MYLFIVHCSDVIVLGLWRLGGGVVYMFDEPQRFLVAVNQGQRVVRRTHSQQLKEKTIELHNGILHHFQQ